MDLKQNERGKPNLRLGLAVLMVALASILMLPVPVAQTQCIQVNATARLCAGAGTPEAALVAPVGSVFIRTDGGTGTVLYAKETGTGNTGWVAYPSSGGSPLSNPVTAAQGGTGLASYSIGDLLYASGATTLSKLADVAAGSYLRSGGVGTAPLWSTLVLPNAATSSRVAYATAANTYGEDADLTFDGSILSAGGGYKERGRTAPVGEWTSVAYSAGNFTANGSMTWTVESGDQITYAYTIIGKTMTVAFYLNTTSVGGTPNSVLMIAIPGGATSAKDMVFSAGFVEDAGTYVEVYANVASGGTQVQLVKKNSTSWATSTNTTIVRGTVTFEIQ